MKESLKRKFPSKIALLDKIDLNIKEFLDKLDFGLCMTAWFGSTKTTTPGMGDWNEELIAMTEKSIF